MSHIIVLQPIGNQPLEQLVERADLRPEEKLAYDTIANQNRRREWLTSKVIAWEEWQKHIDYLPSGAPCIDGGFISISHTDAHIAIIFSDTSPCGIDIESCNRDAARIARKFATPSEIEIARALYPTNAELLVWCAKEVLYKWAGKAGAEFLVDFEIIGQDDKILKCKAFDNDIDIKIQTQDNLLICYCLQ